MLKEKCAIVHGFAKISESIGHVLQLATILCNREVALDKGTELRVEEESLSHLVADELIFML